jgi:transcriptional regulator with XRE-family HTH domain
MMPHMEIEQKERLARRGDMGRQAMAYRLRAARKALGLGLEQLARDMGEGMTKQKLGNAERADNDPPKALMRYFHRAHRIDFNFLIHGDFAQLPADVQAKLFATLADESSAPGQEAGSDRSQGGRPGAQASGQSGDQAPPNSEIE